MKKLLRIIITILIFSFCVSCLGLSVQALSPSNNVLYDGLDVSEWQGSIDFARVKASGREIVYIRSSSGSDFIDSRFETNYANAKANGLKIGFYHYVTARTAAEAREEARFFLSVVSGKAYDCKLAMDFEYFAGLTSRQINTVAKAFLEEVEARSGKEPVIYTNFYTASSVYDRSLNRYGLWIAQWYVSQPSDNGKWRSWEGFQYTDEGLVPGISGYVDLDRFTKDIFEEESAFIPAKERYASYVVKNGDTLSGIAGKYHTTVSELAALNNIRNPDLIYVGEIIRLPFESKDCRTYIVRSGDTLWGIARRFDTTVSRILALNHIKNPDLIFVGEVLQY